MGLQKQLAGGLADPIELIAAIELRQALAYESAATSLGFDETKSLQFVIRHLDRKWRDHQLFAQLTMGHQLFTAL